VHDYTDYGPPIWISGEITRLDPKKGGLVQLANSLTELPFNDNAADLAQLKVGQRVAFTIGTKTTYGEVAQLKVARLRAVE
jgi:hypothetical protein